MPPPSYSTARPPSPEQAPPPLGPLLRPTTASPHLPPRTPPLHRCCRPCGDLRRLRCMVLLLCTVVVETMGRQQAWLNQSSDTHFLKQWHRFCVGWKLKRRRSVFLVSNSFLSKVSVDWPVHPDVSGPMRTTSLSAGRPDECSVNRNKPAI